MDDAVGGLGRGAQTVEVVQVAADELGAPLGEPGGGGVGAGQADDRVAVLPEFRDEGGADMSGGSGDEHAHDAVPFSDVSQ